MDQTKTEVIVTNQVTPNHGVVNHLSFFCVLNKGLDFFSFWLMFLRATLEKHFPKLVVTLLFMPFAMIVFLFGWLLVNIEVNALKFRGENDLKKALT
jgi:hypothetical protein